MKNERKFDSFDEYANEYREIHDENIKITGEDSNYFSEHKILEIKSVEKDYIKKLNILDLGCGDGNSYEYFNTHFPNCQYSGIDISEDSIEIAQRKFKNKNDFKTFNGIQIPFEDKKFDIVFIACVLHHIDHKLHDEILLEVHRVLKKEGRLYIFEHNQYNPITRHIVNTCPFDKDAVLLPPYKLKRTLKSLCFKQNKLNFILFFPRHRLFKYLFVLEKHINWIPIGGQYYTRSIV